MKYVRGLGITLLAASAGMAQLPVKRVVLYKNGVGYFEHVGQVRGNQEVAIPFTSGQLNDVLKSLTVLDQGGGRITGVAYGSSAPMDRQLGDLRLPIGERSSLAEFLGSLRGARLEIKSGTTTLSGRLLSIEHKTRISGNISLDVEYVSLIGDRGEVKTADLSPGFSVRLLDTALPGRLDRYLDIVSAGREPDVRRMIISTEGPGERNVFVSYISEVPVWKSTYRIVLGKGSHAPLLQGWAIVDNTVGQDWENVQLSLVAGAPQSFVQNLSQPYYSRRPEVAMPDSASISPQTYQATLKAGDEGSKMEQFAMMQRAMVNVVGQAPTIQTESASVAEVQSASRNVGSGAMLGGGSAVAGKMERARNSATGSTQYPLTSRAPAIPAAAAARELGDLFEYRLKDAITIRKNNSAMVPIVQSEIAAEKVSIWNERSNLSRPTRALWLTNTSGLTLDGGSFSVMEDDTFAGEGVFEPIRPKERRLVSYAIDLALTAGSKNTTDAQRVTRVRIFKGVMTQESEMREYKTYTFRNQDSTARSVIVEHPVRAGYKLRGSVQPVESTADWLRFRVAVEPQQTVSLEVEEVRPLVNSYELTDIDSDQIELFVRQKSISPAIEQSLRRILEQKNAVSELESKKDAIADELKQIYDDQQRLRENIRSLKGSTEEKLLLQRYTQQMNEQENRLDRLRKQMEELNANHEAAQTALEKTIQELSFEVTI
jgi:hypothetical protein